MNKTQEKALLGDVLPERLDNVSQVWDVFNLAGGLRPGVTYNVHLADFQKFLQTERQRREAIGMLIEDSIGAEHDQGGYDPCQVNWLESTLGKPWEEIRTIWEENL